MSQLHSPAQESILDALSFAKFSYATCSYGASSFTWTHVGGRDDLGLVFHSRQAIDKRGNRVENVVMDIHAGAELLESQDLGELAELSKGFGPSTGPDHLVQVVTKCPCLAMRYPKAGRIVRRIQLRFRNESEFNRALDVINKIGLHTLDNIATAQSRSHTILSPAPSMISSSSSSSTGPPCSIRGSLGTLPASIPAIIRSDVALNLPSTRNSSLYLSQIEQHGPISQSFIRSPTLDQSNSSVRSRYFPLENGSQPGRVSDNTDNTTRTLSASPFLQSGGSHIHFEGPRVALVGSDNASDQVSKAQPDSGRPSSAPITPHIQSLSIPPRRELPFPSSPQNSISTAVSSLRPLPKPTPVNNSKSPIVVKGVPNVSKTTSTHNHIEKRGAPQKAKGVASSTKPKDKSVLNKTAPVEVLKCDELAREDSVVRQAAAAPGLSETQTGSQSKPKSTRKRNTAPARRAVATKRLKMVDQGTQTQTLSGRDHTVMQRSTPTIDENATTSSLPPTDQIHTLDKFVNEYKDRLRPTELWEAPGYTEASEEQRDILLADFVCDNLDNPEFLQLCQDAERAWCRIGLGM